MTFTIHYGTLIDWKKFRKLPSNDKHRLKQAIEQKLMNDPLHFGKPLRQSLKGHRSLRVGEYRIIYRVEKEVVEILLFGHRSNVYSDV